MNAAQYTKTLSAIGHIFFISLIIMCAIFYQERMIPFDSAYYAFKMVAWEDFYIAHGRSISYFSQALPLLALKLNCSLKTFLILFSLSFGLFYYLIYNIIVYGFKNVEAGIFMALSLCLLIRYKFYIGVSETPSSIALAALLIGWMTKNPKSFPYLNPWWDAAIAIGLMLLLCMGHPMIVMPLLIFLGFDLVYNKKWLQSTHWTIIIATCLTFYFKFQNIQTSSYEGGRLSILEDGPEVIANLQDYYIYQIVIRYIETDFHLPFALFITLIGILLWQKRVLSAIFMLSTSALLFCIIMISCSYVNGPIYSLVDGYFGYLGMAWSVLIFYVVIKNNSHHWLSLAAIVLILTFSVSRIYSKKTFFQNRLHQINAWINNSKTADKRKFLLHAHYYNWKQMWYPWAIPFETLFLSALENPNEATTIFIRRWDDHFVDKIPKEQEVFLGPHFNPYEFSMEDLNGQYFRLHDKDEQYEYIGKKEKFGE